MSCKDDPILSEAGLTLWVFACLTPVIPQDTKRLCRLWTALHFRTRMLEHTAAKERVLVERSWLSFTPSLHKHSGSFISTQKV